jgi:hypothetical protein
MIDSAEDEAFNEIERQSLWRKQAVLQAIRNENSRLDLYKADLNPYRSQVIDEVAEFPAGSHDDYVDTVSMAMHRFRRGGYVTTNLDEPDDIIYFKSRKQQGYY